MSADAILAHIAELMLRLGDIQEAWISPAQRRWAIDDTWAEIEALQQELDVLAKEQENEK